MLKKLLLSFIITQFIVACSSLPSKQEITPPEVRFADGSLIEMGLFQQTFGIVLNIRNPNDFDLPITGAVYDVTINGHQFGKGLSNKQVKVERFAQATIETEIAGNLLKLAPKLGLKISDINKNNDTRIKYSFSGVLKTSLDVKEIPFSEEGEISISELMNR